MELPVKRIEADLLSSTLANEVETLAQSLGVRHEPTPDAPYSTDAFIAAVKVIHDQLRTVHRQLTEKGNKLADLEHELACREVAVAFRERKMDGVQRLTRIVESPKRGWFR
jgi:hypothetical protein